MKTQIPKKKLNGKPRHIIIFTYGFRFIISVAETAQFKSVFLSRERKEIGESSLSTTASSSGSRITRNVNYNFQM